MKSKGRSPLTQKQLLDQSFLDERNRVLEVAAFLDRFERAKKGDGKGDFRYRALLKSLSILNKKEGGRVKKIQMILSDPSTKLLPSLDQKSADGAYRARK